MSHESVTGCLRFHHDVSLYLCLISVYASINLYIFGLYSCPPVYGAGNLVFTASYLVYGFLNLLLERFPLVCMRPPSIL